MAKKVLIIVCAVLIAIPFAANINAQFNSEPILAPQFGDINAYHVRYISPGRFESVNLIDMLNYQNSYKRELQPNKVSDGLVNAATSWIDIPREVVRTTKEENIIIGATFGLGKGVAYSFVRGTGGAVDVATFGMSPYDKPLVQPEYKSVVGNDGFRIMLLEW